MRSLLRLLIVLTVMGGTSHAFAACTRHPGDFLVGEDDDYYYCESPASSADIRELTEDLRNYLTRPPPREFLGLRWRFRKNVIDTAGCVGRNHTAYGHERPVWDPAYSCRNPDQRRVDCSNLAQYAERVAACAVHGFFSAKDDVLSILGSPNNAYAYGQWLIFKRYEALRKSGETISPGDLVFFGRTYPDCTRPICHVAVFVGRRKDGKILVIQG